MKKTFYDFENECNEIDETLEYPKITICCHAKDCTETKSFFWSGERIERWFCEMHRQN